jgi:hypothetical protein
MTIETIPFLVILPDEEDKETKGIFSPDAEIGLENISIDRLKENLGNICQGLSTVLSDIKKVGGFKLTEVTIGVEVTAEGGGMGKCDWFDDRLLVSPLIVDCEDFFEYTAIGEILPSPELLKHPAATETIERLRLNIPKLQATRTGAIDRGASHFLFDRER